MSLAIYDEVEKFLSTPSARRATCCFVHCLYRKQFLSTPSARRATQQSGASLQTLVYFYPRPPRGGRRIVQESVAKAVEISIHALREEGDVVYLAADDERRVVFLSTPSARRATPCGWTSTPRHIISIHALREEGDKIGIDLGLRNMIFLSTPSARRATSTPQEKNIIIPFLSTPSARRATAKTETKSLFSNKLYNILHEFRRALIYNGSKNYPNHAK